MSNAGLTQSNIAGDRQNQDPLFVEYEWKPSFVIKIVHRTPLKIVPPSCCLLYHNSYNNRNGHIKQGKMFSQRRKCIFFQYLCNSNQPHFPAVFSPALAVRHIGSADRDPQQADLGQPGRCLCGGLLDCALHNDRSVPESCHFFCFLLRPHGAKRLMLSGTRFLC